MRLYNAPWWSGGKDSVLSPLWTGFISRSGKPCFLGFPAGLEGKESAFNVGDLGLISGLGRFPGGEHGNLLRYSSLENPHLQRSLAGYRPQGRKELDTTERLRNKAIQKTRGLQSGCCCPQAFLTFFLSLVCLGVIHYHLPLIDMHIQFRARMRQDFLVAFVTFA